MLKILRNSPGKIDLKLISKVDFASFIVTWHRHADIDLQYLTKVRFMRGILIKFASNFFDVSLTRTPSFWRLINVVVGRK